MNKTAKCSKNENEFVNTSWLLSRTFELINTSLLLNKHLITTNAKQLLEDLIINLQ